MSLPAHYGYVNVDLDGYVIGPTSSDEFQALLLNAIPPVEGNSLIHGRAQWTGLKNVKQHKVYQSVTVFTDFQMLFLWWHELREKYEILIRLPYSDVHSIEFKTPGFGAFVEICHNHTDIEIGDQVISIDRITQFNFLSPGVFIDKEKTEKAFEYLNQKIVPAADSEQSPNPCESELEDGSETAGFGEDDFTNRP
jgi:hypothetical protein